jgi:branched-chain amino acid transport system permease protein
MANHHFARDHLALAVLGLLLLGAWPGALSPWMLAQLNFIAIYIIAGAGLMLLAGYSGQLSLCHAAFIGIGAYTETLLQLRNWPIELSLPAATVLAGTCGVLAAWPARRLAGIYLAIATLSFGFIVQEVFVRWESLTNGNAGLSVPLPSSLLAGTLSTTGRYLLAWLLAGLLLWLLGRLLESRHGRACLALREDSHAASVLGIHQVRLQTLNFVIAAALGGLAGGLYAHQIRFISPEQFDWVMSIELLMMLVIGGLGRRAGIVLGAVFLLAVPQGIALLREHWPGAMPPAGLELFVFGLALVLSLRFAPAGLAGWLPR